MLGREVLMDSAANNDSNSISFISAHASHFIVALYLCNIHVHSFHVASQMAKGGG